MPIKPEHRKRYPKDWPQIRARILERANNECEWCGAPNGQVIARGAGQFAGTYMRDSGLVVDDATGEPRGTARGSEYDADRFVTVVLTIAHLDHVPEHCDDANLKAGCQMCHLRYDRDHHKQEAAKTRRAKKAARELFEPPGSHPSGGGSVARPGEKIHCMVCGISGPDHRE